MKAMLLAAGRGERLRPLTESLPKPLVPVRGRPLIAWHLQALARAGVREVVINVSWLADKLRAALGDGAAFGVQIDWSEEGPVPLETGGGIFRALPLLGPGPFLVVNADIWCDIDFATLSVPPEALAKLVLVPNPPHHPLGDFALEGDRIIEGTGPRFTYSGVGVYWPEFFHDCWPGRFPLLPLLQRALAYGRLHGELHHGRWYDVGTLERLTELEAQLSGVE